MRKPLRMARLGSIGLEIVRICLICSVSMLGQAQQTISISQFPMMQYFLNPAYAGMEGVATITGFYRSQWPGIEGHVSSRQISTHTPYYAWSGGLGAVIHNIESGVHTHNSLKLSYNYVNVFPNNLVMSVGLSGGLLQRSLDGRKIRTPGGNYEGGQISHSDPILPVTLESGIAPDFDFGIYLAYDRLEGGISIQQLLNNPITLQAEYPGGFVLRRTFNFIIEYEFYEFEDFTFTSSALLRTDGGALQTDFLGRFQYKQNIQGGFTLRGYNSKSLDALAFFGLFRATPAFSIGYSYDVTLSLLNQSGRGAHEIILKYSFDRPFGLSKKPKIIYSPRL